MCTGYLADQIENEFGDGRDWDIAIEYSKEEQPLGTAGAVKLAQPYLRDVLDFFVMNGDSFLEIDFRNMMKFHRDHDAIASMAIMRVGNTTRYGTVHVDESSRIRGFVEKTEVATPGLVNGGVYVFNHTIFQYIPEQPGSLEIDIFPRLLNHGMYAQEQHGMFIDIGTPADYARAQHFCDLLYKTASRAQPPDSIDER